MFFSYNFQYVATYEPVSTVDVLNFMYPRGQSSVYIYPQL